MTTAEETKKHISRYKSDIEFARGGADVTPEGNIVATEDQKKDAKMEMGEEFYKKYQREKSGDSKTSLEGEVSEEKINMEKEINGVKIILEWGAEYDEYTISFPEQISKDKESPYFTKGDVVRIGRSNGRALDVFNYSVAVAEMTGRKKAVDAAKEFARKLSA